MKKTLLIFLLSFLFIYNYAQINTFGNTTEVKKDWFFALRLIPNLNGGLVQTAIVKENGESQNEVLYIPINQWLREIVGLEISKANHDKENLIKK
ncbi:MAG: hypothetical protein L3J56_01690, partial [Bacteroidales bacterium]|nr:hypothetical protein [Bacteroidales bacterium]